MSLIQIIGFEKGPIIMQKKLIIFLMLFFFASNSFISPNVNAADNVVSVSSEYLVPLFRQVKASLSSNPTFYPHGIGMNPTEDLGKWLRKEGRMNKFIDVPLNSKWESLDDPTKLKFKALVKEGQKVARYKSTASLSLLWKLARANPDLDVYCCGPTCKFKLQFGSGTERSMVILEFWKEPKYYKLSWSLPESAWENLPLSERKKLWVSHFKDPGYKGTPNFPAYIDSEAKLEIQEIYNDLLEILDPIKTYTRTDVDQCDL